MFSSPPPLAPPTSEEDKLAWLRLLRSRRVGPTTFYRLMAEHGTAEAALAALPEVAAAAGVTQYSACPREIAQREFSAGKRAGARLLAAGEPHYPKALRDIPDAPPLLWAQGDLTLLNAPTLAVIGARNASSLGRRMAARLSSELSKAGHAICSGLARGVDTEAHKAALEGGTIAVVAGGVDVTYPQENAALMRQIAEGGLVVSEEPPGLQPQARHFPKRNRIISGLSRAVVVVEAGARSGSLITARMALDQGREVLAVPGHPFDARASGCNLLLRDGATLIRGADDVIEALGLQQVAPQPAAATPKPAPAPADLPRAAQRPQAETRSLHARILGLIGPSPVAEDQLARDLSLPAQRLSENLLSLELDGQIARQPGGLIVKTA
ncbi:DNA-processing protein DprA [Vannielia litorea]|uniref:DNA-processing protein DprA n=1 Tax=Vannielia litorea TaxID=1217970 RepID=UPI003F84AA9F